MDDSKTLLTWAVVEVRPQGLPWDMTRPDEVYSGRKGSAEWTDVEEGKSERERLDGYKDEEAATKLIDFDD